MALQLHRFLEATHDHDDHVTQRFALRVLDKPVNGRINLGHELFQIGSCLSVLGSVLK